MAAIYGPSVNFWNISIREENLKLQQILEGYFSTISLTTGLALALLAPFIMFANGIVIAAIWRDPYKQLRSSPSNSIIASMAVCDFLVGLVAIIFSASWTMALLMKDEGGIVLAPVAYSLSELLLIMSLMHILGLTIDRVLAVVNPLLYKSRMTRKRAVLFVILVWVVMTLLHVPRRRLSQYYYINNVVTVTFVGIIASLTACLCCLIIYKVRRQTKIMKKRQNTIVVGNRIVTERDRKTTKSILLILVLFLLCIMLYFFSAIVLLSCSSCHPRLDVIITAYYLSLVLLHVNSAINPILYAFRIPKFRKPVVFIMKKIKRTNYFFQKKQKRIVQEDANLF